jgi:hypothetical protein
MIAPLPNLKTLVVYDIDPLCYPDDISILLLAAKRLENLKLHWNPRMRDTGEESINMLSIFGRCITAQYVIPVRRLAIYNLYTRFTGGGLESVIDSANQEEITVINSMGSSDPTTVFVDDSWRVHNSAPVPPNLKMFRTDSTDRDQAVTFSKFKGLERLYLVSKRPKQNSKSSSAVATPSTPSTSTSSGMNSGTPILSETQCRTIGSEYLAVIQSHHRTLKHLLLSDLWIINDDTLYKLCQSLPNLEQLGFSCNIPPLESMRQILAFVPKMWAMRTIFRPGSELAERMESMDTDMHIFAMATEMWKPEYRGLKYIGFGDKLVFKLGNVVWPKGKKVMPEGQDNSMNARRAGPMRKVEVVSRESVSWIEIWGLDSTEFETKFP